MTTHDPGLARRARLQLLVLDDERSRTGASIEEWSRSTGAHFDRAPTIARARAALALLDWDVVVLGTALADGDPLSVVQEMTERPERPALLAPVRPTDVERFFRLQEQGIIVVPEPFDDRAFRRGLSAAFSLAPRRPADTPPREGNSIVNGPIVIDLSSDGVYVRGERMVQVRGVLYRLFRYLVQRSGAYVRWPQIESQVFGAKLSRQARNTTVHRLRAALGPFRGLVVTTRGGCGVDPGRAPPSS